MKSKISCFDAGIARNLARRFWPLWAVYFAAMVVAFPLELTSVAIYSYAQANARVLECAMQSVRVAIRARRWPWRCSATCIRAAASG